MEMERKDAALLIILLMCSFNILPFIGSYVATQDCFVEILSVSLDKSVLAIGEQLQVNVTYTLYYDPSDPLASGAVTVTVKAGQKSPILTREFTETGINVEKTIIMSILPEDWDPGEEGQEGLVQVDAWVQSSYNSMTDRAEQGFSVIRSEVRILVTGIPDDLVFHDTFDMTIRFTSLHNSALPLTEHPVHIVITRYNQAIVMWNLTTTSQGYANRTVETERIGTGGFTCNITSEPNDDYIAGTKQVSFAVANASLVLNSYLNTSTLQTYYPSMNNCTALVIVNVTCTAATHDMQEANVSWHLGGEKGMLPYQGGNRFMGEVPMPRMPGEYNFTIYATLANHTSRTVYHTLIVELRRVILDFSVNRTEAAYGDPIGFTVSGRDAGCQKPVKGKEVSIFVLNGTTWILITNLTLDDNGTAQGVWKAQELNVDDVFTFKAVFHGGPEFEEEETSITLAVSKNVRLLASPILHVIRGRRGNFTVKVTTLDYEAISGLTVYFIEEDTNETWCTTFTNTSGYAWISWVIPTRYELGAHDFLVVVYDATEFLGKVSVEVVVYDATVMKIL